MIDGIAVKFVNGGKGGFVAISYTLKQFCFVIEGQLSQAIVFSGSKLVKNTLG
jgi:hypothetical protein